VDAARIDTPRRPPGARDLPAIPVGCDLLNHIGGHDYEIPEVCMQFLPGRATTA